MAETINEKIAAREHPRDCPFCDYAGPSEIIRDFGECFVIEPLRQITPGHVLVVPRRHVEDFAADPMTTATVFETAASYWRAADRFGECNLITSKGRNATQSVFHLHVHVVPRVAGDGLTLPWKNPHELDQYARELDEVAPRRPALRDLPVQKARPL